MSFLTGMLCWYDEPTDLLQACVKAAAPFCDRIVAMDGGYELVDGAQPRSPQEQETAILDAGIEAGVDVMAFLPPRLWKGQVEKRNKTIEIASLGSTWVMPLDADWILSGDPERFREEMDEVTRRDEEDAIAVTFSTPAPPADTLELAAHAWHYELAGKNTRMELIFRVLKEMRVERHHWFYSGIRGARRIGLWGCQGMYPPAVKHQLAAPFRIDHVCFFRDRMRIERNRVYCARRDLQAKTTGAEA